MVLPLGQLLLAKVNVLLAAGEMDMATDFLAQLCEADHFDAALVAARRILKHRRFAPEGLACFESLLKAVADPTKQVLIRVDQVGQAGLPIYSSVGPYHIAVAFCVRKEAI
jgi:hypothetical protein